VKFDQHSPHHAYDVFTHIAHVVENTPPQLTLRWAALLHDIGKPATCYLDETGRGHFPDHAKVGAQMANEVLLSLKAPTALREQVVELIGRHMVPLEPDKKLLRRRMARYGVQGVEDLYALQMADFCSKGVVHRRDEEEHFRQVRQMLDELLQEDACLQLKDLAVSGTDLIQLGIEPGPQLGAILHKLLEQVIDQELPNEKQALLEAAKGLAKE
jgi:tRNA nucleotidyltransferase (CCA-adding enzyme)